MEYNNRRKFLHDAVIATVAVTAGTTLLGCSGNTSSSVNQSDEQNEVFQFSQVKLPYSYDALEPYIDALTMEIHYTKHHTAYIKNVNEVITADKLKYKSEKDFFDHTSQLSAKARNNGGGAWNHNFFWEIMSPGKERAPQGKISDAINGAFGSYEKFKEQFTAEALGRFGSGWAWLVNDNGNLKIGSTANQDNPLMDDAEFKGTPLLAIDVWEHAYYLKYQNKRNEYIANWLNVVNWDEVAKRLV
jgi:Fe-Mn family superoxide dismutase